MNNGVVLTSGNGRLKCSIQIHTKKGESATALGYCVTLCSLAHIHAIQYRHPAVSPVTRRRHLVLGVTLQ
jgi:hypothetical protein